MPGWRAEKCPWRERAGLTLRQGQAVVTIFPSEEAIRPPKANIAQRPRRVDPSDILLQEPSTGRHGVGLVQRGNTAARGRVVGAPAGAAGVVVPLLGVRPGTAG